METLRIIRPKDIEWRTCKSSAPLSCKGIAYLQNKTNQINLQSDAGRRRKLDDIRQAVDEIASNCPAFNCCHQKHDRKAKLEILACQMLRRDIIVDKLGGEWIEHDYTIPVGRSELE